MYVFILSKQTNHFNELICAIDNLIFDKYYNTLSLYSSTPLSLDYILSHPAASEYYYILIDSISYPDVITTIAALQAHIKSFVAGVLATSNQYACTLLNTNRNDSILGYINPFHTDCLCQLNTIFRFLSTHYQAVPSKLCINQSGTTYLINYNDIYYIETKKGSHYCIIYYTYGSVPVRASIRSLIDKLDSRFLLVRASTIANITAIDRIDYNNRIIHFSNQLSCTYSQTFYADIRNRISSLFQSANTPIK